MGAWKKAKDKAEQIIREEIDQPRGVVAEAERVAREAARGQR